jgi:hypothetical protein
VVRTAEEVFRTIEANRDQLRRLGVKRLGLFGSLARGEASAASDLDFLVELERKSFSTYMDVKFLLEELFVCHVDLVLPDSIKPRLRPIILKEAIYVPGF